MSRLRVSISLEWESFIGPRRPGELRAPTAIPQGLRSSRLPWRLPIDRGPEGPESGRASLPGTPAQRSPEPKRLKLSTPDRARTCNLQLRRLTLYPIELRGRATKFTSPSHPAVAAPPRLFSAWEPAACHRRAHPRGATARSSSPSPRPGRVSSSPPSSPDSQTKLSALRPYFPADGHNRSRRLPQRLHLPRPAPRAREHLLPLVDPDRCAVGIRRRRISS